VKSRKASVIFVMSIYLSVCQSVCLSICLSVRPYWTVRLPLDGFSWNWIFECISKMRPENSSFVKTCQK